MSSPPRAERGSHPHTRHTYRAAHTTNMRRCLDRMGHHRAVSHDWSACSPPCLTVPFSRIDRRDGHCADALTGRRVKKVLSRGPAHPASPLREDSRQRPSSHRDIAAVTFTRKRAALQQPESSRDVSRETSRRRSPRASRFRGVRPILCAEQPRRPQPDRASHPSRKHATNAGPQSAPGLVALVPRTVRQQKQPFSTSAGNLAVSEKIVSPPSHPRLGRRAEHTCTLHAKRALTPSSRTGNYHRRVTTRTRAD